MANSPFYRFTFLLSCIILYRMTIISQNGFSYLLQGLALLNKPGIRRYVVIPLLLNIVIYTVLLIIATQSFSTFYHWFDSMIPSWLHWLSKLLWFAFFLMASIVVTYSFTAIANLVAAPFNSLLAEQVQLYLTGKKAHREASNYLVMTGCTFWRELRKMLYYLPRSVVLLLCFFIPVIQIVASLLWLLFNSWMMALQYQDYPYENNGMSFHQTLSHLKSQRWQSITFGLSIQFFLFIPLLNLFIMPASVAAATAIWIDNHSTSVSK